VWEQKFIFILWQSQTFCNRQKDDLHSVKLVFCAGTKVFEEALNTVKFLGWLKKFGLAQNILGPVKGQSINVPGHYVRKYSKVPFLCTKLFQQVDTIQGGGDII
jgi:hypothetical protein